MVVFLRLYSLDFSANGNLLCKGKFLELLLLENEILQLAVLVEKVRSTVIGMALLKALGVDRFHAKFYQAQ